MISETAALLKAKDVREAWGTVLSTREGRLVIWSILEECHLFAQTHHGHPLDGLRAGMRDVGLRILNDRVFPHDVRTFATMQIEHAELMQRIEREAELEAERTQDDE